MNAQNSKSIAAPLLPLLLLVVPLFLVGCQPSVSVRDVEKATGGTCESSRFLVGTVFSDKMTQVFSCQIPEKGLRCVGMNEGIARDITSAVSVAFADTFGDKPACYRTLETLMLEEVGSAGTNILDGLSRLFGGQQANENIQNEPEVVTEWYDNGQKKREVTYKDGKKNGRVTEWHENGQKRAERNYKDGERNGLHTTWYANGQKWYEMNYKDGEVVEKLCCD